MGFFPASRGAQLHERPGVSPSLLVVLALASPEL